MKKKQSVETTVIFLNLHGPRPFGLTLGKTEKLETQETIKKEGGEIEDDVRKRPATSVFNVKGLPIEYLHHSQFWFYLNVLYAVTYEFKIALDKNEFYITLEKLQAQYGMPIKYIQPHRNVEAGLALWKFGDIEVELNASRVSENMDLHYRYIPLAKEAENEEAGYSFSLNKKPIKKDEKGL